MTTTLIPFADIAEYRRWRDSRTGPAYLRGLPAWVWCQALRNGRQPATVT